VPQGSRQQGVKTIAANTQSHKNEAQEQNLPGNGPINVWKLGEGKKTVRLGLKH
jgi:hypothetical protein